MRVSQAQRTGTKKGITESKKESSMKRMAADLSHKTSFVISGIAALIAIHFVPLGHGAPAVPKPSPQLNLQQAPLDRDLRAGASFAPVIKKVAPSVVNIYSSMTIRDRQEPNPFFNDPFFRRFFGDD